MAGYDLGTIGFTVVNQGADQATASISALASRLLIAERHYRNLDRAKNKGLITLQQYGRGVQQVDSSVEALTNSLAKQNAVLARNSSYVERSQKGANRFGMVAQQVGYQVGDFFVQVQSGTNALTAFGQQGTQLAGLLPGVSGAIVGIGISLGTALGMVALRGQNLTINFQKIGQDILSALEPVRGLIDALGTGLSYAGQVASQGLQTLIQNLDRIVVYGGTVAALFAGRYVVGLVAATAATASLSGALIILRGALIRTGIGVIIVGAGELVYQFTRLVSAAGGFGNAISLLRDVVSQAWDRMSLSATAMWAGVESAWRNGQATIYDSLQGATDAVVSWGNTTVGVFQGAFDAMKAIWSTLPAAIGDFTIQAANSVISGVESMLNAVVQRINGFITSLSTILAKVPGMGELSLGTLEEVDFGGIENKYAGAGAVAGKAAGEAFSNALGQTYIDSPDLFGNMASGARETAKGFDEAAVKLAEAANKPLTAWQKLKGLGTDTDTKTVDLPSWLTQTEEDPKKGGAGGSEKDVLADFQKQLELERELLGTSEAYQKVRQALGDDFKTTNPEVIAGLVQQATEIERLIELEQQRKSIMDTVKSSLEDGFMSMVDGTKSVKDAFKSMAAEIIKELYRVYVVQQIVGAVSGGIGSFFGGGGSAPTSSPRPMARPVGLAVGGSIMTGKSYLVGENGPELVIPRHSGTVVNANQTANAGAGSGSTVVNNNITVTGSDAAMVRAEVAKMIPQITNATKAAVIDARLRGGQMKQAFR